MTERSAPTEMPTGWLGVLAAVRALAELGLLVALGFVGAAVSDSTVIAVVLAILLPLAGAVVWGMRVAPRARRRLPDPSRLVLEIVLFVGAAAALVILLPGTRSVIAAVVLLVAYAASTVVGRRGY
jgi:hypothetical protein